jgi:predicted metal-dependent hydrolase
MEQQVRIIRSANRKRTISARVVAGILEVRVPHDATAEDERMWVERMRRWAERRDQRRQRLASLDDGDLVRRANLLNERYFDGKLRFTVHYVATQEARFGSCSPDGSIRIADRVAWLPAWVIDYVLMHELTHIVAPNHSPAFWRRVARYPLAERARGYLMALGAEPPEEAVPHEEALPLNNTPVAAP